jgi:hypothetical protein
VAELAYLRLVHSTSHPSGATGDMAMLTVVHRAAAVTDPVSFEEQERVEYVPSARSTMDNDQLGLQHSSGLQCSASQHSVQEQQQQPLQPADLGPELTDTPAALEEGSTVQADAAATAPLPDWSPTAVDPAPVVTEAPALPAGLRVTVIEDADSGYPGELWHSSAPILWLCSCRL